MLDIPIDEVSGENEEKKKKKKKKTVVSASPGPSDEGYIRIATDDATTKSGESEFYIKAARMLGKKLGREPTIMEVN